MEPKEILLSTFGVTSPRTSPLNVMLSEASDPNTTLPCKLISPDTSAIPSTSNESHCTSPVTSTPSVLVANLAAVS